MKMLIISNSEMVTRGVVKAFSIDRAEFRFALCTNSASDAYFLEVGLNLVIMDESIDFNNCLEGCRVIRQTSNIPLVLITAHPTLEREIKWFQAGGSEYLSINCHEELFALRLRSAGRNGLQPNLKIRSIIIVQDRRQVYMCGKEVHLKPKEYELLCFMYRNNGRVMPRYEILDKVWGPDYFGSDRTVDTHIKCLRKKLPDIIGALQTISGIGYMLIL